MHVYWHQPPGKETQQRLQKREQGRDNLHVIAQRLEGRFHPAERPVARR
jgi:hypothetical protein